jgi:hypothetical protein
MIVLIAPCQLHIVSLRNQNSQSKIKDDKGSRAREAQEDRRIERVNYYQLLFSDKSLAAYL